MSATQAEIHPLSLNLPPVCSFSNPELKRKFPILSSLDIPLVFSGPQQFLNSESISACLLVLGEEIEKYILTEIDTVQLESKTLYTQKLSIDVEVSFGYTTKFLVPRYTWQMFSLKCLSDHYDSILDLCGHRLYNLSKRVAKVRLEH